MRRIAVVFLLAVGLLLGRSAFGVVELIGTHVGDGGFESPLGLAGPWAVAGGSTTLSGISFAANPAVAHNGSGYLSMGNVNGQNTQIIFQSVNVPTNTLLLQYGYFLESITLDPANSAQFSGLIADSNGIVVLDLDSDLNGNSGGYAARVFNLTNFAGQTIHVAFRVDLAQSVGASTTFNIDDVSMFAFTPADIPPNDFFTNSTVLSNTTNKISVVGTNVLATKEAGETNIAKNAGGHSLWWNWTAPTNGIATISTIGSSFNTLLGVFTGDSVSNLAQIAANANGASSQVKIPVSAGVTYQIGVDGKNGAIGIVELNLAFLPDTKNPTVAITSPANNAKLTNSTVIVRGTASDNVGVASVQFRLENAEGTNDYEAADGTNSWTATITNLIPGPNTIRVFSMDLSGDKSATVARTVTFVVVSPLTVNVSPNGSGTVSPNLNGLQDVGASLTITAKPGPGQVFSNWVSGDVVLATTATLTFTMQSNLVLQANFVPNPFTPLVGTYQGLFYDSNNVQHVSSGFFNVTLAGTGSYSAKVMVAGQSFSFSGQFSAGGVASNNIVRKGLSSVSVQLQLDLAGNGITGILSDGTWTAQLNAEPVATVATAAHYTLLIPGGDDGIGQPGGDSYGAATVSSTGDIAFKGALAEGTKVSQKANVLVNGQWAFYIGLYSGKGSIFGWLTLSNEEDSDITGTVDWFKLSGASGKFYPGGFTNISDAMGSIYLFTNGVPVLNLTNGNGQVVFSNGNLARTFTNQVTLSTANKVTNLSENALALTLTTSSGLFKVTATKPGTSEKIAGSGVVLQKQNFGGGFFLGTNQTGRVVLSNVSP